MSALRIVEWGRAPEIVDVAVPQPAAGQVRVRVAGCGLCHSDLTMAAMPGEIGEALGWQLPFTLGHETAGWVDAWGSGVEGYTEGEPVALVAPASCGQCRACRRGLESACANGVVGRGYGRDGGLAEFVIVEDPDRSLLRLGNLDPRFAGPLTDAGATSHHAVARVATRVRDDGAVLVIGAGGLGSFVIQLSKLVTGGKVVAVDPLPHRRDKALELGADFVVDGVGTATVSELGGVLGGLPVDAVVDLVGSNETIAFATKVIAPAGSIVVVGAAGGSLRRPVLGGLPGDVELWSFQGSDLADVRAVLDHAAAGELKVETTSYPLSGVMDAYEAMENGTLEARAVVHPASTPKLD